MTVTPTPTPPDSEEQGYDSDALKQRLPNEPIQRWVCVEDH